MTCKNRIITPKSLPIADKDSMLYYICSKEAKEIVSYRPKVPSVHVGTHTR